jgi:hypothetical protein
LAGQRVQADPCAFCMQVEGREKGKVRREGM